MTARKGTRPAEKLRWVLLRVVLLLFLALFGLEYAGYPRYGASQFFDWGRRIVQSDSLSEAVDVLKNGMRRHDVPLFPGAPADLSALAQSAPFVTLDNLPESEGRTFIVLYGNEPQFSAEFKAKKFLPTRPRGPLGMVKPTGWRYSKYEEIDKKYLYNRCHLLAFQLTGENANKRNLITGTRHFNVTGMLPFENRVADYIRRTRKHVYYRVTPVFKGRELVARGVAMEALSADDGGRAVRFHVFVYNMQPGIRINYADGSNHRE